MNEQYDASLFRADERLMLYAGEFFLQIRNNWYYWSVDRWTAFHWREAVYQAPILTYLRPSYPLEFLVVTGRPLESQLV